MFDISAAQRRTTVGKGVAAWVLLVLVGTCAAQAHVPSLEYQVKASYLYNFTKFVEWPEDVLSSSGTFNLCVLGRSRFGDALDGLQGERVQGRELAFHRVSSLAGARSVRCHLLFVSATGSSDIQHGIGVERGMLTVGETPHFLKGGGVITLVEVNGRIRFKVNQQAAQQAGLAVSSRLLRLALER